MGVRTSAQQQALLTQPTPGAVGPYPHPRASSTIRTQGLADKVREIFMTEANTVPQSVQMHPGQASTVRLMQNDPRSVQMRPGQGTTVKLPMQQGQLPTPQM